MANINLHGDTKMLRVVSLFERLQRGEVLCKKAEAQRYRVNEKSIQRDLDDLRAYFYVAYNGDVTIIYDKRLNGYVLDKAKHVWLTSEEILAISKVLMESRAFCKEEIDRLLDNLLAQCEPEKRKVVQEIIRNEQFHYLPVKHSERILGKLWTLSAAIREQNLVELRYSKENADEPVCRLVEPKGLVFSEYYFYLIASLHGMDYDYPAIFRIDRIDELRVHNEHFHIAYSHRFEEGEFRKRVQFMYAGPLIKLRFRFWGKSLDAVLDRLPTARIINQKDTSAIIEAEVYGQGVKMWLLSQAEYLEVLKPASLREDMQKTISNMLKNYV